MADAITSFFLLQANRTGNAGAVAAPSALELGSDNLTRNPRLETLGKLFSAPSGASNIAGLDSFLAVHTATKAGVSPPAKTNARDAAPELKKNGNAAQDVFIKRETSAEARLKELLKTTAAPAPAATSAAEDEEAAAAPAITRNKELKVGEGASAAIDSKRLSTSIPGARPQDIIYTLNDGPRHGQLELAAKPGKAVTTFTQQDLNLGRLRYVSDGSEARGDSFDFTVSGGEEELSGNFGISISPVNDAPAVSVNEGLNLDEGAAATITAAELSASDPDNIAADTVFTIAAGPQHGRIEFADNAGTAITSFTQADIAAGRVRYVNDGSENTADSFTFSASDGSDVTAVETFSIGINPVDDSATVVTNTGGTVAEGGGAVITGAQLASTDVDTPDAEILYNINSGPANGYLEFTGNAGTAINSFTQADINAGRVRYVHNGSETSADSFSFTVTGSTATTAPASFAFTVTPVDDAPVRTANTGVTAAEGGTAAITTAQLNATDVDTARANITYAVTTGPLHGRLEFADNAGVAVTSFTQQDLDSGRLRYAHDGSETTSDSFTFTTSDASTTLAPANFSINVTPVDDAPTINSNGATVTEGNRHTLTQAELNATDPDTTAANLVYTVTTAPSGGQLERIGTPGVAVTTFTQADINAGNIRFVHDGTEAPTSTFGFTLSDGTTAQSGSFTFAVTPVNDRPTAGNNTGASVSWLSSTIITAAQLSTNDVDSPATNLVYTVTNATDNGRLELTSNPGVSVTTFTQADINAGRLRYVHTNFLSVNDQFRFRVSDEDFNLPPRNFNITVN